MVSGSTAALQTAGKEGTSVLQPHRTELWQQPDPAWSGSSPEPAGGAKPSPAHPWV